MKKIKYEVTNMFSDNNIGDILDAYLIEHDVDRTWVGFVYHPKTKDKKYECNSIELCELDKQKNVWKSFVEKSYINISEKLAKHLDLMKEPETKKTIQYPLRVVTVGEKCVSVVDGESAYVIRDNTELSVDQWKFIVDCLNGNAENHGDFVREK